MSTISTDVIIPCGACEVQKAIGADKAVCFDLNGACTGFVLAYNTALVIHRKWDLSDSSDRRK